MNKKTPVGEPVAARPAILVVEDEPLLRFTVCYSLQDVGFRSLDAADGQEALTILREQSSIVLVFADIDLPGSIDGVDLAHLIRRDYPSIKILLTSGRFRSIDSNFPFLPKPYHFVEVRRQIDRLLAR